MLDKGEERAIVHGRHKLILSSTRPPELYDLDADPGETRNLWASHGEGDTAKAMTGLLEKWAARTGDPLAPTLIR